jgi:hypothetical protein
MSVDVVIRPYRPADEGAVLDLLNLALGQGRALERSPAFFRWKHVENPFGHSLMLLADGQEVLGLRAFLRWQFRAGTETVQAVRAVDTATHPGYQRLGVFSRLTRASLEQATTEGVRFVFNTPNQYSLPGYLKLGWTFVGRTTVMVRPLRPLRMARGAFVKDAGTAEADAAGQDGRPINELLADSAAVDALVHRDDASLVSGIRTNRSAAYLRWRYGQAPSLRYGALWAGESGLRAAAIFRRTRRRGLTELSIPELLFDDARWGRRVVRDVLAGAPADYAVAHCAWRSLHRRVLLSLGFLPVPRVGPNFTVRPLGDGTAGIDPTTAGNWRLSLGDLEVF